MLTGESCVNDEWPDIKECWNSCNWRNLHKWRTIGQNNIWLLYLFSSLPPFIGSVSISQGPWSWENTVKDDQGWFFLDSSLQVGRPCMGHSTLDMMTFPVVLERSCWRFMGKKYHQGHQRNWHNSCINHSIFLSHFALEILLVFSYLYSTLITGNTSDPWESTVPRFLTWDPQLWLRPVATGSKQRKVETVKQKTNQGVLVRNKKYLPVLKGWNQMERFI